MKVIFLDHDGVICLSTEWGSRHKRGTTFDKLNAKAVKVLNEILEETGVEIVISSDWKLHADIVELKQVYVNEGILKLPIDVTPKNPVHWYDVGSLENARIMEIQMYLAKHPEITHWVAVDDLEMFDLGKDHFVHCPKSSQGIKQSGIKDKIIKILLKDKEDEI